jgi:23S rRNA (pseudouridine1915-N3)-methyltransferase
MPEWISAGFDEYARRMPRRSPLQLIEIRPERRPAGNLSPGQIDRMLKSEAERVRTALPAGAVPVVLDERGQSPDTQGFARLLEGWLRDGRDIAFIIGGADGLEPGLKNSAHLMLSLSAMTLPHQLVRVLLAEQLYRAMSLLGNHPYHRA